MVHSKESLSLQDTKKALSGENVQPLVNVGSYTLGANKPSNSKVRFRNKVEIKDGKEISELTIYDAPGDV